MASVTLEEKRLKQLKQQLFGKEQPVTINLSKEANNQANLSLHSKHSVAAQTALIIPTSLKTDLVKIVLFSTIAITIQFLLFFAHKQGLISFFR